MTGPVTRPLLRAILFDMDGTLADTEELHRQAFNLAFAEFSLPWQWSPGEYHDLLTVSGGRERIRRFLRDRRPEMPDDELEGLAASVHQRKSVIYRDLLSRAGMQLRPGVRRLLEEAAGSGIALGIATSSSRRNVETLITATLGPAGLSRFRAVVTCDEIPGKKPRPDVYLAALAQLGVDGHECIAIEDTRNGNLAALAAGIATVITTHRFTIDNDFTGASLVVDQLGEPGNPMHVLAGVSPHGGLVDVAALRAVHARGRAPAATGKPRDLAAG